MQRSLASTKVRKRARAVIVTVLLAVFTNIAISYAADAFSTKKAATSHLPSSPRPKAATSNLPVSPRP